MEEVQSPPPPERSTSTGDAGRLQMEEGRQQPQQQHQRRLARPKFMSGVGAGIPKERLQEMLSTREAIKAIKQRGHNKLKAFAETLPQETQEAALLHPLISRVGENPRHVGRAWAHSAHTPTAPPHLAGRREPKARRQTLGTTADSAHTPPSAAAPFLHHP